MNKLIYDRTQADVTNATPKGQYNPSDLNRVEEWCDYLQNVLQDAGYPISITTKTNWTNTELRTASEMERIRSNIKALADGFHWYTNIYNNAEDFNYLKANNWEKILSEIYEQFYSMCSYYVYSGVASAGSNRIYQNRFRHFATYYENYLESTGTQYIDTGIKSQVGIKVEMQMQFTTDATSSMAPFGSHYSSPNLNFQRRSGTVPRWYTVFNGVQTTNKHVVVKTKTPYKLELYMGASEQYFKANGETIYNAENEVTGVSTRNLFLFQRNSGTTYPASMKLYYCKIWLNDVLVRDFIPNQVNGTPCLFDNVTQTNFYNQGTGNFIYN